MNIQYLSHFGSDDMVVDCARVSLAKTHDQYTPERNHRLIRYLAKHGHWTPFAHPQIQLRIEAPIFVARQWMRSNVGVIRSETSRRYVDNSPEFFMPDEWRARPDGSIKQGSGNSVSQAVREKTRANYQNLVELAEWSYMEAIEDGIAPEQARMILPQSMETQWIETGSLAYYARICKQRLDVHAQVEIQELAQQVADSVAPLFPVSWPVLLGAKE